MEVITNIAELDDFIVNTKTMAFVLGYTERHVRRLVEERVLVTEAPGRFNFMKNIRMYMRYLQASKLINETPKAHR